MTCILCTIGSLWYLCYGEDTADTAVANLSDRSVARPIIGALFGFAAFGSVSFSLTLTLDFIVLLLVDYSISISSIFILGVGSNTRGSRTLCS